ncbi:MAG TPA: hypothetical protein PKJ12_07460, partial [Ottowia sp.]|nr:hypothetical protein [Ottowia sp.]HNO42418.1 hypothetical protein [Ottowia sp.]
KGDISIWAERGHFYFGLTVREEGAEMREKISSGWCPSQAAGVLLLVWPPGRVTALGGLGGQRVAGRVTTPGG